VKRCRCVLSTVKDDGVTCAVCGLIPLPELSEVGDVLGEVIEDLVRNAMNMQILSEAWGPERAAAFEIESLLEHLRLEDLDRSARSEVLKYLRQFAPYANLD